MKNRPAWLMMALAVVLGLAAVALASRWLLRQTPSVSSKIVVAGADVSLGQRLAPEMLKLIDWPADNLPAGATQDPLKFSGRVLKSSVLRGEPLTEAKLAPVGTVGGLSALITEGKRAITVRVNDVIGVAGFALPGNYVDIIVHTQKEADDGGQRHAQDISKIVLERILVLAVAQEVGRDDTKPRVVTAVTLEVTPEQAENLDLARSVGSLSLVLRNQIDPQPGVTAGATKLSLLNVAPTAEPAAAPAPMPAPRPARARPADARRCSGVIDGARQSRECF